MLKRNVGNIEVKIRVTSPTGNIGRVGQNKRNRPLSRRLDRCDRVIQNESRDPFGGNVYYVTMQITFLTRNGAVACGRIYRVYEFRLGNNVRLTSQLVFASRELVTKKAAPVLTRFNKIATQGAPQMAVDKEANSLSRVYSYYSKFNLRLFYV